MGFDYLATSRHQYNATRLANGFAGIATLFPNSPHCKSTANRDARSEERLAERTRIAHELHDTFLLGFLAISMQLHAVVDPLSADCAEQQRLSDILQFLDRVLEEGRGVLQRMRSPSHYVTSLGEAFARVPIDLGFSSSVGFRVVVLGTEKKLRTGLLDDVYGIGREAIINACRHSRATDIEAEVEYRANGLRIAVRDNGCGIGPQVLQLGRAGHWGLQGMRERAERVGARLRLWSRIALGTEVELSVPARVAFERIREEPLESDHA